MVAQRFAHLNLAVGSGQDAKDDGDVWWNPAGFHELAGGRHDVE